MSGSSKTPAPDRFWPKVNKTDSCWLWTGATTEKGYGRFWDGEQVRMATHVAWFLAHKKRVPDGLFLCHRCDTPACVNVAHLFLGTKADNNADRVQKGRDAGQKKTHCPRGHEYTDANTRRSGNGRACRTCIRDTNAARYEAIKADPERREHLRTRNRERMRRVLNQRREQKAAA